MGTRDSKPVANLSERQADGNSAAAVLARRSLQRSPFAFMHALSALGVRSALREVDGWGPEGDSKSQMNQNERLLSLSPYTKLEARTCVTTAELHL